MTTYAREWESEAARLAPLVDGLSAVVLVGDDPTSTAEVAVELARLQAGRRRVTIGDLVGELPALEALISHDDPHGVYDSITYGISFERIGHPVDGERNLFIMPSGTDTVASESILTHPRWPRVVTRFRHSGQLLMLVARPDTPGIQRLIDATDGAIVVGDDAAGVPGGVIARTPPRGVRKVDDAPVKSPTAPTSGAADVTPVAAPAVRRDDAVETDRRRALVIAAISVGVIAVLIGMGAAGSLQSEGARAADRATPASSPSAPAADPPPPVENPEAEADAAAYALVVKMTNTAAGARDNLDRLAALPAATSAPSLGNGSLWFKVFVGAYADRAMAESLRVHLERQGHVAEVAFLPFAFLVADSVPADSAGSAGARYRAMGVPAYALLQPEGTARVYAGAFTSPDEAMHLAPVLRAAGLRPRIVYRTGRPL